MNSTAHTYSNCLSALGGMLKVRTGSDMPAQPSWRKAQTTKQEELEKTSELNNSGRYFFGHHQPAYLSGFSIVQQQPTNLANPASRRPVGFFDGCIDPARAGSFHVQTKHTHPGTSRDFLRTKE